MFQLNTLLSAAIVSCSLYMLSCTGTNKAQFRLSRFLVKQEFKSGTRRKKKSLLMESLYNTKENRVYIVRYSRHGCNAIDSLIYKKMGNKFILEKEFDSYSVRGNCRAVFTLRKPQSLINIHYDIQPSSVSSHVLNNHLHPLIILDTLGIVGQYLSQEALVLRSAKKNNIKRIDNYIFLENFYGTTEKEKYNLFSEYGIDLEDHLNYFSISIDNNKLIEDKFIFDNNTIIRKYYYNNKFLDSVKISKLDRKMSLLIIYTEINVIKL